MLRVRHRHVWARDQRQPGVFVCLHCPARAAVTSYGFAESRPRRRKAKP